MATSESVPTRGIDHWATLLRQAMTVSEPAGPNGIAFAPQVGFTTPAGSEPEGAVSIGTTKVF